MVREMADRGSAAPNYIARTVLLVLGPVAFVALVAASIHPGPSRWPTAILLSGVTVVLWTAAWLRPWRIWMPVTMVAGLLGVIEIGLVLTGYDTHRPMVIQFGFPRPDRLEILDKDPDLFWRLPKDARGLNSKGLMGPEFELEKPDGTRRIAFFGDSCTYQGFPGMVARLLDDADPTTDYESVNLAVAGYTSHQGRVLAERWCPKLDADLGVIYFGWNDHWQAYGFVDSERAAYERSTLKQLAQSILSFGWLHEKFLSTEGRPMGRPRVSLTEYEANVRAMGDAIVAGGGLVLLLTAPTSFSFAGIPERLAEEDFVAAGVDALELHEKYNDVVRAVAADTGWPLLDLQQVVVENPRRDGLFKVDGIHFTSLGLNWISRQLFETIRSGVEGQEWGLSATTSR